MLCSHNTQRKESKLLISASLVLMSTMYSSAGAEEIVYAKVKGYKQGKPHSIYVSSIHQKSPDGRTLTLSPDAARGFREMKAAAAKDGFHLYVTSAFRTHREQHRLRLQKGGLAAEPGYSSHQLGMSVDIAATTRRINGKKHRTILYWWLVRNAKRFGFYNDVERETWHWTFYKNGFKSKKKRNCTGDSICKKKNSKDNNA